MKILLMLFIFSYALQGFAQERPQGIYAGLEKIYKSDSMENQADTYTPKKYQWFHLSYVEFRGDSVFLEQMPVSVYKRDTIFSASDDGLFSYSGIISSAGTKLKANLTLNNCDTCPMQMIDFTPAKGTSDIQDVNAKTEDEIKKTAEVRERNKYKILIVDKVRNSKNITVNGNVFRPQPKPSAQNK
jgi:hypothetical protein